MNYKHEWARSIYRELLLGHQGDLAGAAQRRGQLRRHRQLAHRVALRLVLLRHLPLRLRDGPLDRLGRDHLERVLLVGVGERLVGAGHAPLLLQALPLVRDVDLQGRLRRRVGQLSRRRHLGGDRLLGRAHLRLLSVLDLLDQLPRGLGGDAHRRLLFVPLPDAGVALEVAVLAPLVVIFVLELAAAGAGHLEESDDHAYLLVALLVARDRVRVLLVGVVPVGAVLALPDPCDRHPVDADDRHALGAAEAVVAPLAAAVAVHEELRHVDAKVLRLDRLLFLTISPAS